jgi:ribonuclease BN (tRNA processing enzyme)
MGLRLTILGCDGSYPGPRGACSGYLVRGDGVSIWLDAGSGTLANLQLHLGLHQVDAIVLSHEHADHWSDVEGFFVAVAYVLSGWKRPVPVYAPTGVRKAAGFSSNRDAPLVWHDVAGGDVVDVGGLRVTFSRTDHPPETLAARIDGEGRSLGYSADTGPGWSLAALGPGLDLALCEATYLSSQEGSYAHMSARQAGETARAAGSTRLLLTHLWPTVDRDSARLEAEVAFGRPVEMAELHRSYDV